MLGLDLNETDEIEINGAKWLVGAIPWGKAEELRISLGEATDAMQAAGAEVARTKEAGDEAAHNAAVRRWQRARVPYLEAAAEIVRWGIRGTPVEALNTVPLERETFAGVELPVLAPQVVEAIKRVGPAGDSPFRLVDVLAGHVLRCNDVSPEDLLGFK